MQRAEVMEKIGPIANMRVREVQHTRQTKVAVQPDAVMLRPGSGTRAGTWLPLTPQGTTALAKYAKFPTDLIKQLSPDLFGRVATELLARQERYALVMDGDEVANVTKPGQHHTLAADRVLTTIEQAIGNGTDYHHVLVNGQVVQLEIVGESSQPVIRGDLVRAGAQVAFSPLGTIFPSVQSFVLRLTCTNGATANNVLRSYNYGGGGGEGDDVWHFFREAVRDAYRSLGGIVTRWREMRNERIAPGDRAAVLESMLKEAGIRDQEAAIVRARAIDETPRNAYDVHQLVTWASSHVPAIRDNPERVQRVQRAAASFADADTHTRLCPTCHRNR